MNVLKLVYRRLEAEVKLSQLGITKSNDMKLLALLNNQVDSDVSITSHKTFNLLKTYV